MSEKHNSEKSAFELLNSEFEQFDLRRQNSRNIEAIRRRQAVSRSEQDESDEEKGSGCVSVGVRILLIVLLAGALAWLFFMPAGSLGELWDYTQQKADGAVKWVSGLISGTESGDGENEPVSSEPGNKVNNDNTAVSSEAPGSGNENGIVDEDHTYLIKVYRKSQIVIVYDSAGNPVKTFGCSSGKDSTPTRTGEYSIRAKYRWRLMVGNCYTQYASSFSGSYLFHSIPYNTKSPDSMSDSSYDKLGNPASSGCVRLCCRDSKWIYDNCPVGTRVYVLDEEAPKGSVPEIIPERIKDKAHSGWDPTDDSPDSPYNN